MGAGLSTGPASPEVVRTLFDPADSFAASRGYTNSEEGPGCDALAAYSILGGQPERLTAGAEALARARSARAAAGPVEKRQKTAATSLAVAADAEVQALDRSMGCVLGNAVGDALGAPLEFSHVRYGSTELTSMCQDDLWESPSYNRFNLRPGQWTDDSAMALCIADSLLCRGAFDGIDLRQRFYLWNRHGYNNAFGRDPDRSSRASVGLGGNISESMHEWEHVPERKPQTSAGNRFTSGNGSVMRNGPIPVWFRDDLEAGMLAAYQQSKTTHGGDEAAELCRLLTFLCARLIGGAGRELLDDVSEFHSPLYNVTCLAAARCEEWHAHNSDPVFGGLENRRWDWRSANYRYCERRAKDQPGYVGSYAMDAVAMALHCVHSTRSFEEATLKAANLRGDSDSVCAVVGQLAGALYGASAIPASWLERVQRWDGGSIAARALMLHEHKSLPSGAALTTAACKTAQDLGISVVREELAAA